MIYRPFKYWAIKALLILLILALVVFFYIFRRQLLPFFFGQNKKISNNELSDEGIHLAPKEERLLQEQEAEIEKTGKIENCDQIENKMYRSVCRNSFIMKKAKETQDAKLCRQLDNSLVPIGDCEKEILLKKSLQGGDPSFCDQASDRNVQNICKKNVLMVNAVNQKDKNLCQKMASESDKLACNEFYTFSHGFISDIKNFNCAGFSSEPFQSDCRTYQRNFLAGNEKNCENIKTAVFAQLCKYGLPPKQ